MFGLVLFGRGGCVVVVQPYNLKFFLFKYKLKIVDEIFNEKFISNCVGSLKKKT